MFMSSIKKMKKIISSILVLVFSGSILNAQSSNVIGGSFTSNELAASGIMMKKGKQEQKNSMILMGIGVASYSTALILGSDGKSNAGKSRFISVLKITGVSMSAISIPMFFSGKSKSRSSRLMLGIEKLDVPVFENAERLISFGFVKNIY